MQYYSQSLSRASTEKRVLAAAPTCAQLLTAIHDTAWTAVALQESQNVTAQLQSQLRNAETDLLRHGMARTRRASACDNQQAGSTGAVRRLAKRWTGKPVGKLSSLADDEEERKYLALLQSERSAQERVNGIRIQLANATSLVEQHTKGATQHYSLQAQLDDLYESIFGSTASGFPDEEESRCSLRKAGILASRLQGDIQTEDLALKFLHEADKEVAGAMHEIKIAARWTKAADVPFAIGARMIADAGEKTKLSCAQRRLEQAKSQMEESKLLQPLVNPLSNADVAKILDGVSDGTLFKSGTEQSFTSFLEQTIKAQRSVFTELEAGKSRRKKLVKELRGALQNVESSKKLLRTIRTRTGETSDDEGSTMTCESLGTGDEVNESTDMTSDDPPQYSDLDMRLPTVIQV